MTISIRFDQFRPFFTNSGISLPIEDIFTNSGYFNQLRPFLPFEAIFLLLTQAIFDQLTINIWGDNVRPSVGQYLGERLNGISLMTCHHDVNVDVVIDHKLSTCNHAQDIQNVIIFQNSLESYSNGFESW